MRAGRLAAGKRRRRYRVGLLRTGALGLIAFLPAVAAGQGLNATLTDVNPDQSSRDATAAWGCASGGRVNGLAVAATNVQVRYAASEWGGLYKSTDGGLTWKHLDGHVPSATWDVEVDPSNANRVYATSFYDGRVSSLAGINVSTDGGATWTHPSTATPPPGFCATATRRDQPSAFGIAIDPDAPQNVYVGTNCGLARSTDSGATWAFVDPTPADGADDVWDVVVHDNGIIDLCGDDGHRRSTDGGPPWKTATSLPQIPSGSCSVAVSPDESYVLFVVSGTTPYESRDGGAGWPTTFTNPAAQGRIPFVAVNDRSGSSFDLWFGDVTLFRASCKTPASPQPGGLQRCPGSGSWVSAAAQAHNDAADVVFDPQAAADACPLLYSSDGGVYRETQGTSPACHAPVWEQPNVTPHGLWLFDLDGAHQAGALVEDLYMTAQDNGTFASVDAPAAKPTWFNRNYGDAFDVSANPSRVVYTQLAPWHLFVAKPGMTGGGDITYPGNLLGFQSLDTIDTFGLDDFVLVTSTGVHVTQDVTASPVVWTQLGASTTPAGACAVQASVQGGKPAFLVKANGCNGDRAGSLWRFEGTGAGTWQPVTRSGASQFGVYAIDPKRPRRVFASDLAAGGAAMVLSEDGGETWQALPELDALMTANGVFRAWNQLGPTDFTSFGGYPQPTLVGFDPEDPEVLVAGGADSGVFVSIDAGKSWERVTDPLTPGTSGVPHLPRPRHVYFDHEPGPGDVSMYVGTQGRGAWRVSFKKPTLAAVEGRIGFLRVHATGSGYGAAPDVLDAEVVVRLDTAPELALGLRLRDDASGPANAAMFERLREAFEAGRTVRIEYEKKGLRIGLILRVLETSI